MRRSGKKEEQNGRLAAGLVAALLLAVLAGVIHGLYHKEYAETDTPNDCFAAAAAPARMGWTR